MPQQDHRHRGPHSGAALPPSPPPQIRAAMRPTSSRTSSIPLHCYRQGHQPRMSALGALLMFGPDEVMTQLKQYFNTDLTVTLLSATSTKNIATVIAPKQDKFGKKFYATVPHAMPGAAPSRIVTRVPLRSSRRGRRRADPNSIEAAYSSLPPPSSQTPILSCFCRLRQNRIRRPYSHRVKSSAAAGNLMP